MDNTNGHWGRWLLLGGLTAALLYCGCASLRILSPGLPIPVPDAPLRNLFSQPKHDSLQTGSVCSQVPDLVPHLHHELWTDVGATVAANGSRLADWLSGAIRIPTETYDDMDPVGVDPRWEAFTQLRTYLTEAFPLVHASLNLTTVNTHGLWYTWPGLDASRKPLFLAAHQDVVPVDPDTAGDWRHPPYSGHFDGENIWGRGSADDKNGLIGILAAVEMLLERGFSPSRTVVLAFGFDEEATGKQGAGQLAVALLEVFGEDSFAMILDEGSGYHEQYGTAFAVPAVAEKGYLDVMIHVATQGGHSSVPPAHTSIGILSALLVHLEANAPKPHLSRQSPVYATMQCLAVHAKTLPHSLRKLILRSRESDKALHELEEHLFSNPFFKALLSTTQAVDLVTGGVKSNALPEQAWAVVNHRIAVESSVGALRSRVIQLLRPLAERFNLTYETFGDQVSGEEDRAGSSGVLTLSDAWASALEPSPFTPTDDEALPYALLAGTIKATYHAHRQRAGTTQKDDIVVAPGIMSGNTDTQSYWRLSKHIFRYNHYDASNGVEDNLHTVNESIGLDQFREMILFFVTLILNLDEATAT